MDKITKIEEEIAYPIYDISVKWTQDGKHDPKYPKINSDLPEGRIHNGTQFYRMYKGKPSQVELDNEIQEWWDTYSKKGENPSSPDIAIKFVRYETWCIGWFNHWTFDIGQTDQEALKSFSKFVDRMERINKKIGYTGFHKVEGSYCLMSAEDRWRWCGYDNGDLDKRTDPPCRCKYCKEQGKIRICH